MLDVFTAVIELVVTLISVNLLPFVKKKITHRRPLSQISGTNFCTAAFIL